MLWAMGMEKELLERIVMDPKVMSGKPVIKGTRIPVDLIVRLVAQGMSFEEILEDYSPLTREDIKAAISSRALRIYNSPH